jgi:hypothetical protein
MDCPTNSRSILGAIRPRLRFSLRLLFFIVTALCIGIGNWAHRARQQRRAVEFIGARGGHTDYQPTPDGGSLFPAWLITTIGDDYFHTIAHASLKERETIRELPRLLPHLGSLNVFASDVTDEDVGHLSSLPHLKYLVIHGAHHAQNRDTELTLITDRSLEIVARFPRLEGARLHGKSFSRHGFRAIASSKSLRELELGAREHDIELSDVEEVERNGSLRAVDIWHMSLGEDREVYLERFTP